MVRVDIRLFSPNFTQDQSAIRALMTQRNPKNESIGIGAVTATRLGLIAIKDGRIDIAGSRATQSRQSRQVRKEATVTG